MTYAESGLFWSQCFLPSLIIRKTQAGAGKSSLGLLWHYRYPEEGGSSSQHALQLINIHNHDFHNVSWKSCGYLFRYFATKSSYF